MTQAKLNGYSPHLRRSASLPSIPERSRPDRMTSKLAQRKKQRLLRHLEEAGIPVIQRQKSQQLACLSAGRRPRKKLPAIAIADLSKVFGKRGRQIVAVDHLSLVVEQGEVFGLLGPNGAGKTTLLDLLSGLLAPDAGEIRILGFDMRKNIREIRERLGTVPQETALYDELSAYANMAFHADLYGVPGKEKEERIARLLDLVQLSERKDARVGTFSGGMKRRLAIARALLHHPQIVYLDEPTLGVDVQARSAIWKYIRDLRTQGKTILLTTNYLEEAQALCDRLAIIDHGKLIAVDTPDHLRQTYGGRVISFEIETNPEHQALDLDALHALPGVTEVRLVGNTLTVVTQGEHNHLAAIVSVLSSQCEIKDIALRESNLDEVFLQLTGTALRD